MSLNYIKLRDMFFIFIVRLLMSPYFAHVASIDRRVKFVQGFYFAAFHELVYNFYSIAHSSL